MVVAEAEAAVVPVVVARVLLEPRPVALGQRDQEPTAVVATARVQALEAAVEAEAVVPERAQLLEMAKARRPKEGSLPVLRMNIRARMAIP